MVERIRLSRGLRSWTYVTARGIGGGSGAWRVGGSGKGMMVTGWCGEAKGQGGKLGWRCRREDAMRRMERNAWRESHAPVDRIRVRGDRVVRGRVVFRTADGSTHFADPGRGRNPAARGAERAAAEGDRGDRPGACLRTDPRTGAGIARRCGSRQVHRGAIGSSTDPAGV